ncbi:chalcone isomerase family protein [Shewanella sp. SR44-3]|uniref:chalcone isomerase family protein n=1 Tax=Shewanella sp. SR44-3 TaxID=2760936 RepID=UPI0015FCDF8B|nr:chalcone isomerase family protein [Shewanella sp. SR44-3]MBB1269312.1 chalcone isomerase family protein [Shewanella sp. SR44-3]
MYKYLLLFIVFSPIAPAAVVDGMHKLGAGEMSFLFWRLYRAELYSQDASLMAAVKLDADAYLAQSKDKALRIEYFKQIDKQDLLDATEEQWRHLDYDQASIERWLVSLRHIWPDVVPGDVLTLVVTTTGESHFYFGEYAIGKVEDGDFGRAFLSIWLSKKTSQPQLRAQLLGLTS